MVFRYLDCKLIEENTNHKFFSEQIRILHTNRSALRVKAELCDFYSFRRLGRTPYLPLTTETRQTDNPFSVTKSTIIVLKCSAMSILQQNAHLNTLIQAGFLSVKLQ